MKANNSPLMHMIQLCHADCSTARSCHRPAWSCQQAMASIIVSMTAHYGYQTISNRVCYNVYRCQISHTHRLKNMTRLLAHRSRFSCEILRREICRSDQTSFYLLFSCTETSAELFVSLFSYVREIHAHRINIMIHRSEIY